MALTLSHIISLSTQNTALRNPKEVHGIHLLRRAKEVKIVYRIMSTIIPGLMRCGKSCRLRWVNYLSPDVKRGNFTAEEEQTIINLHKSFGNKWSKIASYLPGRTDNEIKNVWNTHLKKRIDKMNCTKDMISSTSYASSCIMSPADDDGIQNSDKTQSQIIQEPKNPQPIIKKCYEKPEFALKEISTNPSLGMDAKEPLLNSDSPAYSYESSFSNVMPGHEVSGINSKEKKVEIPLDFDVDDFLQIFDSLDHDDTQSNEANGERVDDQIIDPIDLSSQGESISNIASELDQNKWLLRLVESELGLRNDRNELENLSNNELQLYHGVDLMPENSSIDSYSPMWPIFSPQDLGII